MKKSLLLLLAFSFSHFLFSKNQDTEPWQAKVQPEVLQKTSGQGKTEMLIIFKNQADLSAARFLKTKSEKGKFVFTQLKNTAEKSQKNALAILRASGDYFQPLYIINAIYTVTDRQALEKIASLDEVSAVQANPDIFLQEPFKGESSNASRDSSVVEWGLKMIQADKVWDLGYKGQDVIIAGTDTGYEWDHPALKSKYRGFRDADPADHNYNWHDAIHEISPENGVDSSGVGAANPCGLNALAPCDDHNHGTHTMGTMVGEDGPNKYGVAPDARWIGCRNMERGSGSPATYLECFEWFLAPTDLNNQNPDPEKAPHVINNSWYCSPGEGCNADNFHLLETAVNNLKAAGVVVVVSAGNSGRAGCESVTGPPAFFENSFSVGATDDADTIAGFSSRGPVTIDGSGRLKPNVSAPGVNVLSSIRGGAYAAFSGTSMAGPHVAGLVALIISANPDLAGQVETIETIIENTAVPKTDTTVCGGLSSMQVPNYLYGYGRVNALAAAQAARDLISATGDVAVISDLKIFPNPFKNALNVEMPQGLENAFFQLFDLNGKMVFNQKTGATGGSIFTFSTAALPDGLYTYRLFNEKMMYKGKVVKGF